VRDECNHFIGVELFNGLENRDFLLGVSDNLTVAWADYFGKFTILLIRDGGPQVIGAAVARRGPTAGHESCASLSLSVYSAGV